MANNTKGLMMINPISITAALIDGNKRDSFNAFGHGVCTMTASDGREFEVMIFSTTIELRQKNHPNGGRFHVEADLRGAFLAMIELLDKSKDAK